jgi:hypothetical protein
MNRIILIFLLSGFSISAYSQLIRGTIYDKDTKAILNFASIYFNGTVTGTSTDSKGNFELDVSKYSRMPLTISAIGYYSETITDFSSAKPYSIYLSPKVFELSEVVISSKANDRERKYNLKLFRREFLGETANASECEIQNEEDIRFLYDTEGEILTGFAAEPVIIFNKALGYVITYYLDKFEYNKIKDTFLFKGNIIFKEDLSHENQEKQLLNRQVAYRGSRMHFFRTLWGGDLKSAGFTVENKDQEYLKIKDIVIRPNSNTVALKYPGEIIICYNMLYTSKAIFYKSLINFDKNGYYDPAGIRWEGEMARHRIADELPLEYSLTNQ